MTNGQIQQLQDLIGCSGFSSFEARFVDSWLNYSTENSKMHDAAKATLRRLTHQYRNQIRAIKKNQVTA